MSLIVPLSVEAVLSLLLSPSPSLLAHAVMTEAESAAAAAAANTLFVKSIFLLLIL
jgi:hypothetical protein